MLAGLCEVAGSPFPDLDHLQLAVTGLLFSAVAAGPADGPLVILLHGFPEFSYGWRHQIGPLAEAGFRVVVPDQRGYGRSSKPAGVSAYHLDELAADIIGMADACGRSEFSLVGHDWGGIVGWWTAIRYPDRVRRLAVLNAPHPVAARRFLMRNWRQLARSWYVLFFQIPVVPEWMMQRRSFATLRRAMVGSAPPGLFSEENFRRYEQAWSEPGALSAAVNWYRALSRFRVGDTDTRVRQPTLIIWGDRDRFLESRLAEESGSYCDHAETLKLRGGSHWIQHERPQVVNRALRAFLRGEPIPPETER